MGLILSIETSTTVCSVALHREGKLIASEVIHVPNSAASQLAVMVEKIISTASGDLDAVAVSSGPGSYTGLRIGVATAKGICYALDIPLIAVGSLEVMAMQVNSQQISSHPASHTPFVAPRTSHPAPSTSHLLCPMIDARRMEVYTALFNTSLDLTEPVQARIIEASSYSEVLEKREILFFGNGSDKCKGVISHANAKFIDGVFPSAEWLGVLGFGRFSDRKFEDVGDFEPFYLKDFIAKKPKSLV